MENSTDSTKILFVIGQLHVGGAETHLLSISKALKQRGFEPTIFCLSDEGSLAADARAAGIRVYSSKLFGKPIREFSHWLVRVFGAWASFFLYLLFHRPQIVHFFLPDAYVFGGLCVLALRIRPRIMSRRSLNNYQKTRDPWLAEAERLLHPRMTLICGNSFAVRNELMDEGVPPERLRVVYNGVDSRRFADQPNKIAIRERLDIDPSALVLVMVANIIPYKGHSALLSALGNIQQQLPQNWRLLLVGRDDGIGVSLRQQAESLGVAENITWLGLRKDVPYILCAADIGVHYSLEEGFANAILEGMAAGLPMIVSDVGGNPEAIEQGKSGIVVAPNDSTALGVAILQLARNQVMREEMASSARQRANAVFTMDKCIQGYQSLYAEALALEGLSKP